jgi:hypothetical protein
MPGKNKIFFQKKFHPRPMPGKNKISLHIKISSPAYAWEK